MLKYFIKREEGAVLPMAGAALLLTILIVGGAIDGSKYLAAKTKLRHASDQALLGAAACDVASSKVEKCDVQKKFLELLTENIAKEDLKDMNCTGLELSKDDAKLTWNATIQCKLKTPLLQAAGVQSSSDSSSGIPLKQSAEVTWDIDHRVDAVFTVDTSASMCMDVRRATKNTDDGEYALEYVPDEGCTKLKGMKEALSYIIDHGFPSFNSAASGASSSGPAFTVGIVPFNHKVKMPKMVPMPDKAPNYDPTKNGVPANLSDFEKNHKIGGDKRWIKFVGPGYYNAFEDAEPLHKVISLTALKSDADKEKLKGEIDSIDQTPYGMGWTRSNIGALTAAMMLDPAFFEYFDGEKPAPFGKDVEKIVVLMTDGANMGCCYAAHPEGNFANQYLYQYHADNAHLVGIDKYLPDVKAQKAKYGIPDGEGLCTKMKKAGIVIYSVVFDVQDNDPGGAGIKKTYKDCASNEQFYFDVQDPDSLKKAYQTIAQSLLKLRLTQ